MVTLLISIVVLTRQWVRLLPMMKRNPYSYFKTGNYHLTVLQDVFLIPKMDDFFVISNDHPNLGDFGSFVSM